jgi:hypothetical protein
MDLGSELGEGPADPTVGDRFNLGEALGGVVDELGDGRPGRSHVTCPSWSRRSLPELAALPPVVGADEFVVVPTAAVEVAGVVACEVHRVVEHRPHGGGVAVDLDHLVAHEVLCGVEHDHRRPHPGDDLIERAPDAARRCVVNVGVVGEAGAVELPILGVDRVGVRGQEVGDGEPVGEVLEIHTARLAQAPGSDETIRRLSRRDGRGW